MFYRGQRLTNVSCDLLSWRLYRGTGAGWILGVGFLLKNSLLYSKFVSARTGKMGINQMWTGVDGGRGGGGGSKATYNG